MSVSVRLADGTDETTAHAVDFAIDDDGLLSLLDKPAIDDAHSEVAIYAAGCWQRVRIDAPAAG